AAERFGAERPRQGGECDFDRQTDAGPDPRDRDDYADRRNREGDDRQRQCLSELAHALVTANPPQEEHDNAKRERGYAQDKQPVAAEAEIDRDPAHTGQYLTA